MDYKKAYREVFEKLYFATAELTKAEKDSEYQIAVFNSLSLVLSDFISRVDTLHGERKKNAETTLKRLTYVFVRLGNVYLSELKWRKELFKVNKSLLELMKENEELKKQIEILNKLDEC